MAVFNAMTGARARSERLLSAGLAAVIAVGGATSAVPVAAQDRRVMQPYESECGFLTGFVFSETPLTVHERPDAASRVLGQVLGQDLTRPELRILEARNGWLRIIDAHDDQGIIDANGIEGAKAREMYSGVGWVRSEGVKVILQTSRAFAAPWHDAEVVLQAAEGGWLDEAGEQVAIMGCKDAWVLARWDLTENLYKPERYADFAVVSRDPLIIEGWSTGICHIQTTTCDGVDGDDPHDR